MAAIDSGCVCVFVVVYGECVENTPFLFVVVVWTIVISPVAIQCIWHLMKHMLENNNST